MTAIRKVVLQIAHCQCIIDLSTDYSSSIDRFGLKMNRHSGASRWAMQNDFNLTAVRPTVHVLAPL